MKLDNGRIAFCSKYSDRDVKLSLLEVNCETRFVATTEIFSKKTDQMAEKLMAESSDKSFSYSREALNDQLETDLYEIAAIIGERTAISRGMIVTGTSKVLGTHRAPHNQTVSCVLLKDSSNEDSGISEDKDSLIPEKVEKEADRLASLLTSLDEGLKRRSLDTYRWQVQGLKISR